ncbi:TetR/AcrR family transcriptional regulator [Ekhidna sp.]
MPKSVLFDKANVMSKVTDLFWRKGYNGTSMQDLVDVTGLNRSSFYNSFGDKFSLFEESLKYYQEIQMKNLNETFSEAKSPKEAIISLFEGIQEEVTSGKENKGCFLSNCTSELSIENQTIRNFLIDNKDQVVNSFKTLIEQAQEEGEINFSKNADTLALYLFSSLHGLRITSMIDPDIQGVTEEILNSL